MSSVDSIFFLQLFFHHSSIETNLTIPLKRQNENFKRRMNLMEKDHLKSFKRTRNCIKAKIAIIEMLRQKMARQPSSCVLGQIERNTGELLTQYRELEEQERQAVEKICVEERTQFCAFAASVQEVFKEQIDLKCEFNDITSNLVNIDKLLSKPIKVEDIISNEKKTNTDIHSRFSRCGSFRSFSSIVNSRSNSPLCISETKDSKPDGSLTNEPLFYERVIKRILICILM